MRRLWRALLCVLLWIGLIVWPEPPTGALDPSWQQLLGRAWLEHRQFGRDVLFTYGPWGFLLNRHVLPEIFSVKLAFELVGKLLLALALTGATLELGALRAAAFAASLLLVAGVIPDGVVLFILMLLSARFLLSSDTGIGVRLAVAAAMALLALTKFSFFAVAAASVMLTSSVHAARSRMWLAGLQLVASIGFLLFWWVAAGQALAHLPEFLNQSRQIATAYPGAMSIPPSWTVLASMVASLLAALLLLVKLLPAPFSLEGLAAVLLMAIGLGVAWKSAAVRVDAAHTVTLDIYVLLLAIGWPSLLKIHLPAWLSALPTVAALAGLSLAGLEVTRQSGTRILARMATVAEEVWNVDQSRQRFDAATLRERQEWAMPRTRSQVGSSRIDLIGYEQGRLLLNQLNEGSLPVPQSYAAYTPGLLRANADYLQSPAAPEYVLVSFGSIDNRYPLQDDSLAIAEIKRRYEVVLIDRAHVLLRRKTEQPPQGPPKMTELLRVHLQPGEELALPAERSHLQWLQVQTVPTWPGVLRALLYQPAMLTLTTTDEQGKTWTGRLIAGIASTGFPVAPPFGDWSQAAAFLAGSAPGWVKSLRIDVHGGTTRLWRDFDVRLLRVDSLPVVPHDPLLLPVWSGVTEVRPAVIEGGHPWHLSGDPVTRLMLHPPGRLVIALPRGTQAISGELGLLPGAYGGPGHSDGVEIELAVGDGVAERTLERYPVLPAARAEEPVQRRFIVPLPERAGSTLTIRTFPGPANNLLWDWAYVAELRFHPTLPAERPGS